MFVLKSTHDKALEQRNYQQQQALYWNNKYIELQLRWDEVVDQINSKGGMNFLNNGSIRQKTVHQFTDDELRSLLQLVHPDKHGGKQSAITLTQKINSLRNK